MPADELLLRTPSRNSLKKGCWQRLERGCGRNTRAKTGRSGTASVVFTTQAAGIGTGTGFVAAGIAIMVGRVLAVDNAPAMLEVARKNLAELGIAKVELLEGDIVALPLKSASVDAAFAIWSSISRRGPWGDVAGDGPRRETWRPGRHSR